MGNSGSLGKNEINYEPIGMAQKVESKYEESLAEFRPWGGEMSRSRKTLVSRGQIYTGPG